MDGSSPVVGRVGEDLRRSSRVRPPRPPTTRPVVHALRLADLLDELVDTFPDADVRELRRDLVALRHEADALEPPALTSALDPLRAVATDLRSGMLRVDPEVGVAEPAPDLASLLDPLRALASDLRSGSLPAVSAAQAPSPLVLDLLPGPPDRYRLSYGSDAAHAAWGASPDEAIVALARRLAPAPPPTLPEVVRADPSRLLAWLRALAPLPRLAAEAS